MTFRRRAFVFAAALAWGNLAVTAQMNPNDPADPTAGTPRVPSAADSLPSFKTDSLRDEPFRQIEAGAPPSAAKVPQTQAARDSVTSKLQGRRPEVSGYLGVSFLDMDAKTTFANALEARRAAGNLKVLQAYEPVHIAVPLGLQAVLPVSDHFDLVAKTYSYLYSQGAILGDSLSRRQGDESYTLQAHLGGLGARFYVPPNLLSVSGAIALYVQGVYYWQIGGAEIYTDYGSAPADFDPAGSAYEVSLGFAREATKPWGLNGSLGFMQQHFSSDKNWTDILAQGAPAGKVAWGASSLQAALNLVYRFGVKAAPPPGQAVPQGPGQATPQGPSQGPGQVAPQGNPPAAPQGAALQPLPAAASAPRDSSAARPK